MVDTLIQLVILFFVIFDPLVSFVVFLSSTSKMKIDEKRSTAILAVTVAAALSYAVLFLGTNLLSLFDTNLSDFKVAGGIVLSMLGIKMVMGQSLAQSSSEGVGESSVRAIASIIGTPPLTGPAAISAIIMSVTDYGIFYTGAAVTIVLVFTAVLFLESYRLKEFMSKTTTQVLSTVLGLITLAWGVGFIRAGLGI